MGRKPLRKCSGQEDNVSGRRTSADRGGGTVELSGGAERKHRRNPNTHTAGTVGPLEVMLEERWSSVSPRLVGTGGRGAPTLQCTKSPRGLVEKGEHGARNLMSHGVLDDLLGDVGNLSCSQAPKGISRQAL